MSYKIKLLPEAKLDIKEIIEWYNKEEPGLGKRFYEAFKTSLNYIKKHPLHFQVSYRDIRNRLVGRFPYQVHYKIEESNNSIIIFGVTHTSRHPRIWKNKR